MLIIKIVCVLALFSAIAWATTQLIRYCNSVAHPYEPFTRWIFAGIAIAYVMIFSGFAWYSSALRSHSDVLNGIALVVLGGALLAWIIVRHVRGTSLRVGLGISAVQLPIFAVVAYFGIFILVLGFALLILLPAVMGALAPPVVRIVN